jgi:hypothetical protein
LLCYERDLWSALELLSQPTVELARVPSRAGRPADSRHLGRRASARRCCMCEGRGGEACRPSAVRSTAALSRAATGTRAAPPAEHRGYAVGLVLVAHPPRRQDVDQLQLGLLLGEEPLHLSAVFAQLSLSTSPKTARPAAAASRIEIGLPRTSGCSASQRSALRGGGEEVQHRAAAPTGVVAVAADRAGKDDRRFRPPLGRPVGSDARPDRVAAQRVARLDLDRLAEHRRDPERVDRAHCVHLGPAREANPVLGWPAREGVGDGDLAVRAAVNEVLARERFQCMLGVDAQSLRGRAYRARSLARFVLLPHGGAGVAYPCSGLGFACSGSGASGTGRPGGM